MMNIPNEAWRAAEKANRVASESERVTAIVAAAAPHIARAAQVAILREMADELDSFAGRLDGPAAVVARSCASIVRGKSRDMEAGAGQTGETQGKAAWERANGTNGPFGWIDLAEDEKAAWRNAGQAEVRDGE